MDDNKIKELISEAFIKLLMAKNRFKVYRSDSGDHGIDMRIGDMIKYSRHTGGNSYIDGQQVLDIQLKCTTEKQLRRKKNGNFSYDLKVKNYEDLIVRRNMGGNIKLILVLFILPDDENEWMEIFEDQIKLCKHAYWFYPEVQYTLKKTAHIIDKHQETVIEFLKDNKLNLDFKTLFENIYAVPVTK